MAERWNFPGTMIFHINPVVGEVLFNIIFYAFSDDKTHKISRFFLLKRDMLKIRISA